MARIARKKLEDPKVTSAVEWYQSNRDFYKRLALKIELIIKEILEDCKISFHSVTSRTKDVDSFAKKASKDKYSDPKSEILDLAGIRITAYVESDVNKICEVLEREFEIIQEHSVNKAEILKYNEVGYRSVHYIAKLDSARMKLPEYRRLDAFFEIQVRTILQHAWAEIEHDRNYKFEGAELPEHAQIKRRFALLAGQLELADREFDSIVKDIEHYSDKVIEDTKKGKLDMPIDSISL
ncbi:GTP pyrophosphokinase, partial [Bacillus cereus]|uniref:GTP pyrophosphokinase n=1 Tax=Bacillus cereus TaxID=1396 RepID=UPI001139E575